MKNTPKTALASLAALTHESSLKAHVILESLIQGGFPISGEGLSNFALYFDVAWMLATKTLKSPPKALIQSRELLVAWRNWNDRSMLNEELAVLCKGIGVADSLWRQAPPTVLVDVMIMLKSRYAEAE